MIVIVPETVIMVGLAIVLVVVVMIVVVFCVCGDAFDCGCLCVRLCL